MVACSWKNKTDPACETCMAQMCLDTSSTSSKGIDLTRPAESRGEAVGGHDDEGISIFDYRWFGAGDHAYRPGVRSIQGLG